VKGVPVTLRRPHDAIDSDFTVFHKGVESVVMSKKKGEDVSTESTTEFPNEEVLVLSLPRTLLEPLTGYEEDDGLYMISTKVLSALRPSMFTAVEESQPWFEGFCLLPPQCILRSFTIKSAEPTSSSSTSSATYFNRESLEHKSSLRNMRSNFEMEENPTQQHVAPTHVHKIVSTKQYIDDMSDIRHNAKKAGLIPLYHYTSPSVAPLILKGGLRMSTQGQGDGGVYVSTQGPMSYGLGTDEYETTIIKDCFGNSRLEEYLGKGFLDVILVYGCEPDVFDQVLLRTKHPYIFK
jgi:hypothetical protein